MGQDWVDELLSSSFVSTMLPYQILALVPQWFALDAPAGLSPPLLLRRSIFVSSGVLYSFAVAAERQSACYKFVQT